MTQQTIEQLMSTLPRQGEVLWIGVRPERRAPMKEVASVVVNTKFGLEGDRYAGSSGKRQVTLIQYEHLAVIASVLGVSECAPDALRRNIAVAGMNLLALKGKQFQVGAAVMEYTGLCHPCSFMETVFGAGGYNAVRGHGGITAKVLRSGEIAKGDAVSYLIR